jgi:hypothetical protein
MHSILWAVLCQSAFRFYNVPQLARQKVEDAEFKTLLQFVINLLVDEHTASDTTIDPSVHLKGLSDHMKPRDLSNEQMQYVLETVRAEVVAEGEEPEEKQPWFYRLCTKPKENEDKRRNYLRKEVKQIILSLQRQEVLLTPCVGWDPDSENEEEALACRRIGDLFMAYECKYWG